MRHRPAGRTRNEPQTLLKGDLIDLVNNAVDIVAKRRALSFDPAIMRQHIRFAFA